MKNNTQKDFTQPHFSNKKSGAGFTLIELLVVVAITAVISVIVILTLNPAEILRQTRDSTRISDMSTLKSGLSLFLSSVVTSSAALGTPGVCYIYNAGAGTTTSSCIAWFSTYVSVTAVASKATNGGGWIPVNFDAISSGPPFSNLPTDPAQNDQIHFYSYITNAVSGFKLAAKMESIKYSASGSKDAVSTDGGNDNFTYETGSVLSL